MLRWDISPRVRMGIVGRRYFQKGGINRSHHLHGFKRNDIHALKHLAFRDYLRSNPTVALEYAELKRGVAETVFT